MAQTATKFPKFTVAVEGNIGSGKSTLLQRLNDGGEHQIVEEPVGKWQHVTSGEDGNLMARMYENPDRWAYMFQSYVLLTMMEAHETEQTKRIKVMERTVLSARYCFFENLRRSDPPMIDGLEYECLKRWFDWLIQREETKVDLIVYLRTDAEVCMERLKKRARSEEAGVPMSYLDALEKLHDEWLTSSPGDRIAARSHPDVPVLVLDGNISSDDAPSVYAEFELQIEAKVAELLKEREAAEEEAKAAAQETAASALPLGKLSLAERVGSVTPEAAAAPTAGLSLGAVPTRSAMRQPEFAGGS